MKKLKLITVCILIALFSYSQDTLNLESVIKNVVVFKEGAQIKRTAALNLKKGRTTVKLTGLTSDMDVNTIKVAADKNVTVVSVFHQFNYLARDRSNKQIKLLKEQLESLVDSTDLYKKYLLVLNDEKSLLKENKKIGGSQNGVDIENLKATAEFYRERMKEIELQVLSIYNKIKGFNKEIIKLGRQLKELNAKKELTTVDILVVLASVSDQKLNLNLEYFVNNAGWKPYYDIRVADVNDPVKIIYKAKIFQNTDIDWNNVKLTLSTGNPSVSGIKPILNPYILSQNNYTYGVNSNFSEVHSGYVRGIVTDDVGESLPGVSVNVKGTTIGTMTDADGRYTLDAPLGSTLVFSYIGMQISETNVNSSEVNMCLLPSQEEIGEVVVTALGIERTEKSSVFSSQSINYEQLTGKSGGVSYNSYKAPKNKSGKLKIRGAISLTDNTYNVQKNVIPLNMRKNQTSKEFIIDIPYTIRSDNKEYDVTMTEIDLKADYRHHSVPKLSEKVFLTALITDYEDFGMLNGEANIFFKETYTGKTFLDLSAMSDTMNISLGIDNDVIIQREQIKEYTQSKFLGTTRKDSRAWKISVKNMKAFPVNIKIEDQLPMANNNKIKVDNIEISDAKENTENGLLEWVISLDPQVSKDLLIRYAVKYPAYMKLIVD